MIKIDENFILKTSDKARNSERKRMNYNFHKEASATLQRMLNAMEPETYIQPHKHENPDKVEAFFVLKGRILLVEFDEAGNITDHIILDPETGNFGGEISPRRWHTLISLQTGSIAYEVKDGPYDPSNDKVFANWAPTEGDKNCREYNQNILKQLGLSGQ